MSTSLMVTTMSRIVLGSGDFLELVAGSWAEASGGESITRVEVPQHDDYSFDFRVVEAFDPATTSMFVAFDGRFANFKRAELLQAMMARRFQLATIKAPGAQVALDATLGPNVYVGAGAVIGAAARVDYNSVIHAGTVLGYGARIKPSCWIESGVQIGPRAEVAAHVTLRTGVIVAPGVKIGRYCEIGVPGLYRSDVAAKTIIDPRYDVPLVVYGG